MSDWGVLSCMSIMATLLSVPECRPSRTNTSIGRYATVSQLVTPVTETRAVSYPSLSFTLRVHTFLRRDGTVPRL